MTLLVPVWQVGTGDSGRPYIQWMLKHDVVAIGSGWGGAWPSEDYEGAEAGRIRRFADEAKRGELVVARQGTRKALAVGVLGKYAFDGDLDDIEGWDLCHTRSVRWLARESKHFERAALARDPFCRCWDGEVLAWVEQVTAGKALEGPDLDAPHEVASLGSRLDPATLEPAVLGIVERAKRWADYTWGGGFGGGEPSESELLTHITVPLLEALGWPPEQIAIEWAYMDIVLFSELRREDDNIRALIEVKRLGLGLEWARRQADEYAGKIGHQVDVVITDGVRYQMFRAADHAELYANLSSLRSAAADLFDALRYSSE